MTVADDAVTMNKEVYILLSANALYMLTLFQKMVEETPADIERKRQLNKEKTAKKRKLAAENPIYQEIKRRELAEGKKSRSCNRKEDDFRNVDDIHTAVYYFEDGNSINDNIRAVCLTKCIDLRKVKPYYFEYKSFAKGRWLNRPLLEVFASEFRDRNEEYYVSFKDTQLQKI
jgi:hypothetical protein